MKVLITGGAGFLGLHLARYFYKKGHQVRLLDIAEYPQEEYNSKLELIIGDVRDEKTANQATKGMDVVVHAAAALPLWSASEIISTNVEGTRQMLAAAKQAKIKRFIYISSTAVYGVPKKHPIEETDPRIGVGPYGISKIQAEDLCFSGIKAGQPITIIRPKTFVGTERLGVFEILFDWIHDGKRIPVVGNGKNRYQLLDVDDLVEAIFRFSSKAKNDSRANDAFNIGAKVFHTVEQDLNTLFKTAKSGSSLFPTPAAPIKVTLRVLELLHLSPLYQWVYDTADKDSFVSIKKLETVLNWSPKYSNAEALIKSYQWYQQHYDEVKSRKSGVTHTVGWKQGALGLIKNLF